MCVSIHTHTHTYKTELQAHIGLKAIQVMILFESLALCHKSDASKWCPWLKLTQLHTKKVFSQLECLWVKFSSLHYNDQRWSDAISWAFHSVTYWKIGGRKKGLHKVSSSSSLWPIMFFPVDVLHPEGPSKAGLAARKESSQVSVLFPPTFGFIPCWY